MASKATVDKRESLGGGLYRRHRNGKTFFELRYSINRRRRFVALKATKLTIARIEASKLVTKIAEEEFDPVADNRRLDKKVYQTVEDVACYWKKQNIKRLKHPNVPNRRYENHIAPFIGQLAVVKVASNDVISILERLEETPSAANKVLIDLKQIFATAVKLGIIDFNFVKEFTPNDAGGQEAVRSRSLALAEIGKVFRVLRKYPNSFTRDNYLLLALLFCLGVRKSELTQAKWGEFDFQNKLWYLPKERSKTGEAITIPLVPAVINWLQELQVRACGSEYVLPNRRSGSTGKGYMGNDTLNRAVAVMFGKSQSSDSRDIINVMGDVEPFVPHDCRRTARTLLSELGVPPHIAERCLNHKLKGVMAVYDKHDFLPERRQALGILAERIAPLINNESNVIGIHKDG